ncbi:signal recognition particle protein [Candidatus Woesearchaeota archaeon]|nr:signal recognition particle protein [Candidatus Woesearchaeota archaeon]
MLEKLGNAIKKATDKIANAIFLNKEELDEIVRELQRALIEADVNIFLVKELSEKIRKEGLDERIKGIEKKEHLIKLLHDELTSILGEYSPLKLNSRRNVIILLGLYGSGKTTTIAKLGNYYAKRGFKVALVGLDVYRPAASEQLKQLAEKNKLNYFIDIKEKNPVKILREYEKKLEDYNLILIDTAGRHTLDEDLIKEIKNIEKEAKPTESILVIPADIGQSAKNQSKQFKEAVNISGVIVTRMDSTAKAGGALTACAETKSPIYFITNGEKINDIEEFNPSSFLSRLLGLGDLDSLIQKINLITDEQKQKKIQKNIEEGKLRLEDVIEQVKSMNEIGGLSKIKSLIPGFSDIDKKISNDLIENQQEKIKRWEHIIKSMTEEEKENPEIIEKQNSRLQRIAKGSGTTTSEVRALLKQYKLLNEVIKSGVNSNNFSGMMSQKQMMKFAKKFGKKLKF